jgi:hypothetical protein
MRKSSSKHANDHVQTRSKVESVTPHSSIVDGVVSALLDLFEKLDIDASQIAMRAKLRKHKLISAPICSDAAAIGELLTVWHQNPKYLDKFGEPIAIKMRGRAISFYNLAKSAAPNMKASILLSELKRLRAVTTDKNGFIYVRMRALSVYEDKRLAIQHTLTSLNSFIRTLRHNLDSDPSNSDQLFHRVAWNGEFDARLIPALKIKIKRQGHNFLEAFDNWMMRKAKEARPAKKGRKAKPVQIFIGVYLSTSAERPAGSSS